MTGGIPPRKSGRRNARTLQAQQRYRTRTANPIAMTMKEMPYSTRSKKRGGADALVRHLRHVRRIPAGIPMPALFSIPSTRSPGNRPGLKHGALRLLGYRWKIEKGDDSPHAPSFPNPSSDYATYPSSPSTTPITGDMERTRTRQFLASQWV